MDVSVKKTASGYDVVIQGRTITLPLDSKTFETRGLMILGTDSKQLQLDPNGFEVQLFEKGKEPNEIIVEGGDEESETLYGALVRAWDNRSRLNGKARRTKRNRRNTKRRKLRKLASRRR